MNSEDSLQVVENEDGTFTLSWDDDDVKYSFLNDLTEEEMSAMLEKAIEQYLKEYDQSSLESNE